MGRLIVFAGASALLGCPGGKDGADSGETGDTGTPDPAIELDPVLEIEPLVSEAGLPYALWGAEYVVGLDGGASSLLVNTGTYGSDRGIVASIHLLSLPLDGAVTLAGTEVVLAPPTDVGWTAFDDPGVGECTGDGVFDLVTERVRYDGETMDYRVVVYEGPLMSGTPVDGAAFSAEISASGDGRSWIYQFSGASDLDGDGVDDLLLLGEEDDDGTGRLPISDIFLGPVSGDLTSDDRDARHGWTDTLPETVWGIEGAPRDLTGDGYADLVLIASEDGSGSSTDPHRTVDTRDDENETVRLFPGPLALVPETYDEAATAIWYGPRIDEVEAPGDVDGDGGEDLVLRAPAGDFADGEYAASFLLAPVGGASGWIDVDTLTTTWGYIPQFLDYYGDEYVEYFVNASMAVGGDANGDGVMDLWLGAADLYSQGGPGTYRYGPHAWFIDDATPGEHPVETDARAYTAEIPSSEIYSDSSSTAVSPVVWDAGVDATGDGVPDMILGYSSWIKVYSAVP